MKTIPMPEIIARLMKANHCDASFAEKFITEFSAMAERALSESGTLHISGLGTFQRIESGSIVTAEFAPDTALSEAINAPFSIFEPIELDDDVTSEMLDKAADSNIGHPNRHIQKEQSAQTAGDEDKNIDYNMAPTDQNTETTSGPEPEMPEHDDKESTNETDDNTSDSLESEEMNAGTTMDSITENHVVTSSLPENTPPVPGEKNSDTNACEHSETTNSDINQKIYRTYSSSHHSHSSYEHSKRSHRYRHAVNAVLSFAVGVISGFFIHNLIFSNVQTVEISANDVQVYQRNSANTEPAVISGIDNDSIAGDESANTYSKPETKQIQPQNIVAKSAAAQKIVTDTIRGNRFLTTMALNHYGMKKFWVYIYLENKETIKDPDNIAKNTVVVIPPAAKYGIKPGDMKSESEAEQLALEIMQRYPKKN